MSDAIDVDSLERDPAPFSHGPAAIELITERVVNRLPRRERRSFFNRHLLQAAIYHADVAGRLQPPPEPFAVLQGDVIRTDRADILGVRQVGAPSFVVASSTCDVVPGRGSAVLLLMVEPRRHGDRDARGRPINLRNELGGLVALKSREAFYLPPLPDDPADVVYNVVHLDPLAQCDNATLLGIERRASMTLLGWRLFGALLRGFLVREAAEEAQLRRLARSPS